MTAADQVIQNAAGIFDTPAQAIIARCTQSGVHLRLDGESLKAKGDRETIAAWNPMIQRHKPEIIAALTGAESEADFVNTLAADSEELTACIIELCQLAGYSPETQNRMLEARRNLYPFQYSTECAYFKLQAIRAKAGTYWNSVEPSHNTGNATTSTTTRERAAGHPARGRA
ncbi:MAG: hypothetical protein Q8P42_06080 [Gallionella sp.]|nr:hypothetical protein [Gallionella sp.]